MRNIEMTGSDDHMDCAFMFHDPINPLPAKCPKCGFPDLSHVPQPYYLIRSRTMIPNELAPAENGNFLVRPRIHQVLELLAPGQCRFYPTCYKGTTVKTPWLLAEPVHQIEIAKIKDTIPRCEACGERKFAHPGSHYIEYLFGKPNRGQPLAAEWTDETAFHVLKSSTWGSSERGWDQWICRDFYMSVRLFHLFKKIKAKGLNECAFDSKTTPINKEESAWVGEKINVLLENGIPLHPAGTLSDLDAKWLREYVKSHSKGSTTLYDFKALEKRCKFKFPKSYIDFIAAVGPVEFENIDEEEGFTARILAPDLFDCESYRAGVIQAEDDESNAVDGVMFATTGHGDCFCFDVRKGRKEYPVYLYKHEVNYFEIYAENFAACIKRFASGG